MKFPPRRRTRFFLFFLTLPLALAASAWGAERHPVSGMLLGSDPQHHTITVSCREIPGFMDAMVMTFPLRDGSLPAGIAVGAAVEFTWVSDKTESFAEDLRIQPFESLELDPSEARRLKLVENAGRAPAASPEILKTGDPVPDFHLTDQNNAAISLAQFRDKVVALTFVYTRCPRPEYCLRLANNFAVLERRFRRQMGKRLVLLTLVIDPVHDQAGALKTYAATWKADARDWHFLTGTVAQIEQICRRFDMAFYPDEALYVHSFHTVVIGRDGKLAANLEGNAFSARQLGDLVETILSPPARR
jgi:protein SCO1